MRKITIEIDEEIFNLLQEEATPFIDTPNDVLRRLLLKNDKSNNYSSMILPRKTNDSLPALPGGTPRALEHTLQVAFLVKFGKMTRNAATHYLSKIHGVAPQTIIDKYCRQLDLTANKFDRLLEDGDLRNLKEILHKKFPAYHEIINEYLQPQKSITNT